MDLIVRTTTYLNEDHTWLASAHATDTFRTVEIDIGTFTAGTHFPDGFLRSGQVLGKVTASGLYGLYVPGASDGRETAVGHLGHSIAVAADNVGASGLVLGALMWHGGVIEANLPTGHALDAAAKVDVKGLIAYF